VVAILGITVALALTLGLALGGRLSRLGNLRLSWIPILYVALALGILPLFVSMPHSLVLVLVDTAYLLLALFLGINILRQRHLVRMGLVVTLLGWLLNASAIAANGGMPLSLWAYRQSGQSDYPAEGRGGFFKITIAGPESKARILGDVIPIRPIGQVVSIGDLLLVSGIGIIICGAMKNLQNLAVAPSSISGSRNES
jgi:hypothetical protein